ncbi:hypothetical protein AB4Y72_19750, partial [Arthrobacter sp. YAF34]|uniref:hypothetical protein n=1 Tax=Arthrobacter sp. YAF34 TaxID=3233083 RepID=UPI003F8F6BB8
MGDQVAVVPSSDPATVFIDGLTMESKCEVFVNALHDHNKMVIDDGDQLIVLSVLAHYDILGQQFGETQAQQLFQRSFNGCSSHPDETISSQARAAFQSILQSLDQPSSPEN